MFQAINKVDVLHVRLLLSLKLFVGMQMQKTNMACVATTINKICHNHTWLCVNDFSIHL